jgi:hypothetical protein
MKVRTGEKHPFNDDDARTRQFTVAPIPFEDHTAEALRQAQDAYFAQWPNARKRAPSLLWEITMKAESFIRDDREPKT